jgi:hypothetical protein
MLPGPENASILGLIGIRPSDDTMRLALGSKRRLK